MKKLLLATIAVAVASTSAFTADAPVRKNVTPLPTFVGLNWTGIYVGGNVGYSWAGSSFTHLEGGAAVGERFSNKPNGVLGGAQIGGRYQIDNNIVLGAEFAYSFRNADAKTSTDPAGLPRNRISEVGNIWSVSGNVGYAFDSYLAYAKAGYASTELRYSNNRIDNNMILGRSKDNVSGYVVGGGLEYAVSKNVSLAAEYNYYKFNVGNQTQLTPAGALAGAINANNSLSSHAALGKLNYRF